MIGGIREFQPEPRTAEDVLRDLAMSLGVGGYNDIGDGPFDPEKFDRKIRDGIDLLNAPLVEAWRRYLKLRSIGAAPNGTLHLKEGRVMVATNLDRWLDEYLAKGLPPAPSHAVEFGGAMPEGERLFLAWAYARLEEINPSNYDHDDVCSMNAASVEVMLAIKARLDALKALENRSSGLADAHSKNPPEAEHG